MEQNRNRYWLHTDVNSDRKCDYQKIADIQKGW